MHLHHYHYLSLTNCCPLWYHREFPASPVYPIAVRTVLLLWSYHKLTVFSISSFIVKVAKIHTKLEATFCVCVCVCVLCELEFPLSNIPGFLKRMYLLDVYYFENTCFELFVPYLP